MSLSTLLLSREMSLAGMATHASLYNVDECEKRRSEGLRNGRRVGTVITKDPDRHSRDNGQMLSRHSTPHQEAVVLHPPMPLQVRQRSGRTRQSLPLAAGATR